jgi:hypothetical protein
MGLILKAMLQSLDRRTTFVNGVDRVPARNREQNGGDDGCFTLL